MPKKSDDIDILSDEPNDEWPDEISCDHDSVPEDETIDEDDEERLLVEIDDKESVALSARSDDDDDEEDDDLTIRKPAKLMRRRARKPPLERSYSSESLRSEPDDDIP